jgi:uncharacterized protein YuzB (UPF0349 family)
MVKVCCCCSKVDVDQLKSQLGEENVEVGCLENCGPKEGSSFGEINGEMVVVSSSDEFIEKALNI